MELINWGQVITQILGFLGTLWILRRFAWAPMLQVLEARREKIAADFAAAEQAREDMEKLKTDYEAQIRNIDATARQKIADAARDAEKLTATLTDQARVDVKALRDKALADIEREKSAAMVAVRDTVSVAMVSATEKFLRQRLDEAGQRKLIDGFIQEMEGAK